MEGVNVYTAENKDPRSIGPIDSCSSMPGHIDLSGCYFQLRV